MTVGNASTSADGLGAILVTARSFDEYQAMFGLGEADLSCRILDCPSGASSFTAELWDRGGDVTACDAAYFEFESAEIAAACADQTDQGNRYVRAHEDEYSWTFFAGPDDHQRRRRQSVERFVADSRRNPRRYVPGRLPSLPFADDSFDLVLSSHLLFCYADDLDYDFHLRAINELVRVARVEVRIFPLVPMGSAQPCPQLGELRNDLRKVDITSNIVDVGYEFQKGANQMLVCRTNSRASRH
jgi:SAM-dependent methyltransferase